MQSPIDLQPNVQQRIAAANNNVVNATSIGIRDLAMLNGTTRTTATYAATAGTSDLVQVLSSCGTGSAAVQKGIQRSCDRANPDLR
jgi:hypothetical protein